MAECAAEGTNVLIAWTFLVVPALFLVPRLDLRCFFCCFQGDVDYS